MSDQSWEEQFKHFLRRTGEDFRRASEDIKAEAQKLLDAAMDPAKQQRVRDRLNELTLWARKAAQGVAGAVEEAASKAQTAFHGATGSVPEASDKPAAPAKKPSKARAKPSKPRPKSGGKRNR